MCIRYTAEVLARLIVSKKNQHQASFPIQFSNTVPENAIKQCKVQVNTWVVTNPFSISRKSSFLSLSNLWSSLLLFSCILHFVSDIGSLTRVRFHQMQNAKHKIKHKLALSYNKTNQRSTIAITVTNSYSRTRCPGSSTYGTSRQFNN
jgi:hypothetical protein